MSDPTTVGNRLVALCREGKNLQAIDELYTSDVVSVEAASMDEETMPRIMEGIDTIKGKNQWWIENHEVHKSEVNGPYPHGDDRFAVIFKFEVTNKPSGQRFEMEEVGIFTMSGGKINREEFFYSMG